MDIPSFQTTYEELKPWSMSHENTLDGGFQTTYEELKLALSVGSVFSMKASRLPMRN